MANPKYSVIIPVYNRPELIREAAESVLHQTYRNFELIIIDDGSTDSTPEAVKSFRDPRIKYIRQKNAGPAAARNRGVRISSGKYIAFLDSDDRWLKYKLSETDKAIEENPDYYIYHTQEKWYRKGKILNQKKKHKKPQGYVFENCLKLCCISISTVVVRRSLFEKVGFFD
ncbi:MAG: glycosyltransferase family 2 protein, partial [Elusimicrobiota bacterium]